MGAAGQSSRRQRALSPNAKGVGVPMTPERLRRLDRDRARLKLSRGGALAAIYDQLGDAAVDAAQQRGAEADAKATDLTIVLAPLVDALHALDAAWVERANARQRIGVHTNQIAKLANVERLQVSVGGLVSDDTAEMFALALENVRWALEAQATSEREDDVLRSAVRALLDQLKATA